jgi:hypothetical protein
VAAARFAPLCQCSPPTATAIARPRSGLYCRLSTDLLLFAFVHTGCAHVSLASRTSQRLTNVYLTFVHSQSLQPCPPPPSVRCQHLPLRHHPPCCFGLCRLPPPNKPPVMPWPPLPHQRRDRSPCLCSSRREKPAAQPPAARAQLATQHYAV